MKCKQCGKELIEGAVFCDNCGRRVEAEEFGNMGNGEKRFCVYCGRILLPDAEFCPNCGNPVGAPGEMPPPEAVIPVIKPGKPPKWKPAEKKETEGENLGEEPVKPKKGRMKRVIAAAAAVIILAGAGTGAWLYFGNHKAADVQDKIFYLKDGNAWYTDISEKKPEGTACGIHIPSVYEEEYGNLLAASRIQFSVDGQYVYFPSGTSDEVDGACELSRRNLASGEEEFVADDVLAYITAEGGKIFCVCGNEEQFYLVEDKEKRILASGVGDFYISKDGKQIAWTQDVRYGDAGMESDIFFWNLGIRDGEKEKIASEADLRIVSEDANTFVYVRDGILYRQKAGEDRVKIDTDIKGAVAGDTELNVLYYAKEIQEELDWTVFVEDDKKSSDEIMSYPSQEDYQVQRTEKVDGKYQKVYVPDEEAYQNAVKAYEEKVVRDSIREELDLDYSLQDELMSLYCYENGQTKKIADNFYSATYFPDYNPGVIYNTWDFPVENRIKLSDYSDMEKLDEALEALVGSTARTELALGTAVSQAASGYAVDRYIYDRAADTYAVLLEAADADGKGKLIKIASKEEGVENSDVDEGVSELLLASGGSIYYMKENEDGKEILFCNGQQVDEDVEEFSLYHVPDSSSVIYAVDYNEEKERGILKIYNGEEAQTIAEDVHMYQVISPDEIVVLADYSAKYEDGDLKLYSKDGLKLLEEEVETLLLGRRL